MQPPNLGQPLLSLNQVLDAEHLRVTAGQPACGAPHHSNAGEACMRLKGHEEDAPAARESHAQLVTAPGVRYWVTWLNVPLAPIVPTTAP